MGRLRFRLLTGRLSEDEPEAVRRREAAHEVLRRALHVADVAVDGYSHLAYEAGVDLEPYPNVPAWFGRVERQPGYVEDVEPYGANAVPGAGRSTYD